MSERITIAAQPRTVTGKKVKRLRQAGMIPAVIYGQRDPLAIQLERGPLRRVLKQASTSHLVDIELDGNNLTVLAREIQQHVTRGDILHVDFFEVNMQSAITAEAELILVGEPDTAVEGLGSIVLMTHAVDIECLPGDLIAEIEVNMAGIASPDDVIYVSDLNVPKGVAVLTDPETIVARFEYTLSAEADEADEEAGGSVEDVEVIEKGKQED